MIDVEEIKVRYSDYHRTLATVTDEEEEEEYNNNELVDVIAIGSSSIHW